MTPWSAVPVVAVALICLVSGLLNGPGMGVRLVAGVVIAMGVVQQLGRAANEWRRRLAATTSVRLTVTLAVALGVLLWFDDHAHLGSALVVGVLLAAAGVVARELATTGQTLVRTAHLPGAPTTLPPRLAVRTASAATGAALAVVLVVGVLDATPVVAVAAAVLLVGVVLVAARRLPAARRYRTAVAAALARFHPVFVIAYNGIASFHVGMWTPYLAPHLTVLITTRTASYDRLLRDYDLPVLLAPSETRAAVAALIPPTVTTAFYVHNGRTWPFLRHRAVRHVLLHHGDSDKQTGANPVTQRYDTVVVAGQAALDRFKSFGLRLAPEQVVILGRPQTAGIRAVRRPIREVVEPTVLYAPTWKGTTEASDYSSLLLGPAIIAALLRRGVTVIFRPHPAGRHYQPHVEAIATIKALLRADRRQTGRPHRTDAAAEKVPVADVANLADAMISDVSGIVTDFMQSLKPYAMVSTKLPAAAFGAKFPSSAAGYVIEPDLSNLEVVLEQLLVSDPLADARADRRTYYLGGNEDGSAVAFRRFVAGLTGDREAAGRIH